MGVVLFYWRADKCNKFELYFFDSSVNSIILNIITESNIFIAVMNI